LNLTVFSGLIIGASVLTLIELVYFFAVRPLLMIKSRKTKIHPFVTTATLKKQKIPQFVLEYLKESSVHSLSYIVNEPNVIGKLVFSVDRKT
jgi:hypothetical protein